MHPRHRSVVRFVVIALVCFSLSVSSDDTHQDSSRDEVENKPPLPLPLHKSNYAVIVSSSRYWFNYRHAANSLAIYQMVRYYGIPDDNIILMLADEYAVNARNPTKNNIYNTAYDSMTRFGVRSSNPPSLQTPDTEIDYRGEDVTVENFIRVLTGRGGQQKLPVLESDENSNVLIYLAGHGGDQFFKFQDVEELLADQLADAIHQMHVGGMYNELLLLADTCQAFTLGDSILKRKIPNAYVIGSSLRGEASYAHTSDPILGLATIEKYTHYFVDYVRNNYENATMQEQTVYEAMVEPYFHRKLLANVGYFDTYASRNLTQVPLRDFFANVQSGQFWVGERGEKTDTKGDSKVGEGSVETDESEVPVQDGKLPSMVAVRLLSESSPLPLVTVRTNEDNKRNQRRRVDESSEQSAVKNGASPRQCAAPITTTRERTEPSDATFLLLVGGLFATVAVASRKW